MIRGLLKLLMVIALGVGVGFGLSALLGVFSGGGVTGGTAIAQGAPLNSVPLQTATTTVDHPPPGAAPTLQCGDCHGNHPEPSTYQSTPPPDADTLPCFYCHDVTAGWANNPDVWKQQ